MNRGWPIAPRRHVLREPPRQAQDRRVRAPEDPSGDRGGAHASPTEADFSNFRDLLRTAVEKGLIADVQAWFEYRQMRDLTSHTYDRAKARQVYEGTLRFVGDAKALLKSLEARNA